ncbi:MAG: hypothetical protein AAB446_02215 [Patescibacteria group bacterium]
MGFESFDMQEKIIPAVEQESGKENVEKSVAEMFRPLTEEIFSEMGREKVKEYPVFKNISESFA